MAITWHLHSETPDLGSEVLVKNISSKTWNITTSEIQSEFMTHKDIKRWRYYQEQVWHTMEDTPLLDNAVVAEYYECFLWIISDATVQNNFVASEDIVSWCLWDDILEYKFPVSGKTLTAFKEGSDNDWAATTDGYIQLEYDIKALRQQINARIQTLPNEVDDFDGIDYLNIIFGNTSWGVKAEALIEVMKNIPAVKDVKYVAASWVDKEAGEFKMTFSITSIFGDLEFGFGLNNQNKTITLN